jgi:hypothetical protein
VGSAVRTFGPSRVSSLLAHLFLKICFPLLSDGWMHYNFGVRTKYTSVILDPHVVDFSPLWRISYWFAGKRKS